MAFYFFMLDINVVNIYYLYSMINNENNVVHGIVYLHVKNIKIN